MISGFTYIHNAIKAGIPIRESIGAVRPYIDELVVVDAGSNDGTRELLESLDVRIIDAKWGNDGGETLARLHAMHTQCKHDTILHFEADEVFDDDIVSGLSRLCNLKAQSSSHVWRIQVEQNFQRIRWYPEKVHRMFKKGSIQKVGHTSNAEIENLFTGKFLWDVTNCFRDNWIDRVEQQAELRSNTTTDTPQYLMVPLHCSQPVKLTKEEALKELKLEHWTWKTTPLNIPEILKPLVGKTRYK